MENSSVNKAHYQHRRAETHLRYRRYSEAILCHKEAADLLGDALHSTQIPRAVESLRLQRDYHLKQQDIIRIKREQFENYKTAVENQRKRMANAFSHNEFEDKQEHESTTLQVAIYKTMEEADSLLEMLFRRGSDSDSLKSDLSEGDTVDGGCSSGNQDCMSNNNPPSGTKRPKDDHVVIEELRTLNQQLHSLVYQLVTQLDLSSRESDALRSRVKYLENERLKSTDATSQPQPLRQHLQVATDSSGAASPFVISPCSELSPLEMPVFDYGGFSKK